MLIMNSTVLNNILLPAVLSMEVGMEKVYKTMKSVGVCDLVMGIVVTVFGCATGAFLITNGARLLKRKKEVLF